MVVRMRANRSKTGMRRSHAAISGTRISLCSCGANRIAHRACLECGKYDGRVVIDIVARTKREQRRTKKHEKGLKESGKEIKEKETSEKT
ncbi:MAG: 50S ribosomal protein L32 [bacterium]|nr:50S ribosomal protein L32 [bacterium]